MDFNQIKELIRVVNDSQNINEIKVSEGSTDVYINKGVAKVVQTSAAVVSETPTAAEPITILPEEPAPQKVGEYITSPIVGTFYESNAPGKPPLVIVGKKVKKGEVVCIIEAMKVMNEIQSGFDGEIAEVLVKNEQLVEFGQQLFRIV